MTLRFLMRTGTIFRVLVEEDAGCWIISYTEPAAPLFIVCEQLWQFQKVPAPEAYIEVQTLKKTPAEQKRQALIQSLLDNPACIRDRALRCTLAGESAARHRTTSRRVLEAYYRFLATGRTSVPKAKKPLTRNEVFDWAIRTYYYSAKRFSLRTAYDMMILEKFMDEQGRVSEEKPTWEQFRHYFYRRGFHKAPQKTISREGLTRYQRDQRPTFGSVSAWRSQPGSYQMDATQADVYLVSRYDRSTVVGRPYIYMAVDTATQLIAGIYVGFSCDESTVMACLAQAAEDKVLFCRQHEIEITPELWPNCGLPSEIITDKGREFCGSRMEELCRCYGLEIQTLPPFRPDQKGIVEKAFDLLQNRYKPLLRGKGVIEEDAQERWAIDYRAQAVLDLEEFTQVIIHAVLYLNGGRLLSDGRTPAQRWLDAAPCMLEVPQNELYRKTLPRLSEKLRRKGFHINGFWYSPLDLEGLTLGGTYTLAYNPSDTGEVYLVSPDGQHRPCRLESGREAFMGLSFAESDMVRQAERLTKREHQAQAAEASAASLRAIRQIVKETAKEQSVPARQHGSNIRKSQKEEKEKLS